MVIFHSYVAVYQRVLIWLPRLPATSINLRRKNLPGLQGFDGIHLVAPDRSIACNLQRWPALGNVGKRWATALKYVEISLNLVMNLVMNVTKTSVKSCCSWFAWKTFAFIWLNVSHFLSGVFLLHVVLITWLLFEKPLVSRCITRVNLICALHVSPAGFKFVYYIYVYNLYNRIYVFIYSSLLNLPFHSKQKGIESLQKNLGLYDLRATKAKEKANNTGLWVFSSLFVLVHWFILVHLGFVWVRFRLA